MKGACESLCEPGVLWRLVVIGSVVRPHQTATGALGATIRRLADDATIPIRVGNLLCGGGGSWKSPA